MELYRFKWDEQYLRICIWDCRKNCWNNELFLVEPNDILLHIKDDFWDSKVYLHLKTNNITRISDYLVEELIKKHE